jgi:nucleotide-binding universal stress UspA family protein
MAIKPIVVGADGSEPSLRAVDWAAREAVLRDAPLQIVSVCALDQRTDWSTPPDALRGRIREAAENALQDAAGIADMAAHELTTDTRLLVGQPAPVLAEAARGASMLVVGAHGSGGFTPSAAGSVSRYAATHAPCPVVIHRDEPVPARHQIAVGIGDLDAAAALFAFAFEEASHRGAHLVAVKAWYWRRPAGVPEAAVNPGQVSSEALIRLFRLLEPWQEKYPDVEVGEEIRHARTGQALAEITASADLLVLGRHRGDLATTDSHLGLVTKTVLDHSRGPVAVVPESEHER